MLSNNDCLVDHIISIMPGLLNFVNHEDKGVRINCLMLIFKIIKLFPNVLINEMFYPILHSKLESRLDDNSDVVNIVLSILNEITSQNEAPIFTLAFIEDSVVKLIEKLLSSIEDKTNSSLCESITDCITNCFKFMNHKLSCFIPDYFGFIVGMFENTNKLEISRARIKENSNNQNNISQNISLQGCICKLIRSLIEINKDLLNAATASTILNCILESFELNQELDSPAIDLITKLCILHLPVALLKLENLLSLLIKIITNANQFNLAYTQILKLISYLCTTVDTELLAGFIDKCINQFIRYLTIDDGKDITEYDEDDIIKMCSVASNVSTTISDIVLCLNSKSKCNIQLEHMKLILLKNLETYKQFESFPSLSDHIEKLTSSIESTLELAGLMT